MRGKLSTGNHYKRPPNNTDFNKMVNLWMDTCPMFVPYTEFPGESVDGELGRMYGCTIFNWIGCRQ